MARTRCIIYARFSPRRNEEECVSNETQIEYCRQFAKTKDWFIEGIFQDEGFSGDDESRPGLLDALDAVQKGDVLLVYKLDRLARDPFLYYTIERKLLGKKASMVSTKGEGTEFLGPEAEALRGMMVIFATLEKKQIALRTAAAMRAQQRSGKRMSNKRCVPIGTMLDPDDHSKLLPNKREIDLCRTVWNIWIVLNGRIETRDNGERWKGLRETGKALENSGLIFRSSEKWHPQQVKRCLQYAMDELGEVHPDHQ